MVKDDSSQTMDTTATATVNTVGDYRRVTAVVMERRFLRNRWASESWQPVAVLERPGDAAAPSLLARTDDMEQWLHGGFVVEIYRDEAEGYYLNLSTDHPCAFVEWDMVDSMAVPRWVTLSYHEAARRMDGGAQVEGVPMPADWLPWLAAFTQQHLTVPERKKRAPIASFRGAQRDDSAQ